MQNSSILAEIAYETQKQQLELNLQAFNYKNSLLLEQANKKLEIENNYYNRYQNVLAQINQENALAEQIRQYNENMALQREQFDWQKDKYSNSSGGYYYGVDEYIDKNPDEEPEEEPTGNPVSNPEVNFPVPQTLSKTINDITSTNLTSDQKKKYSIQAVNAAKNDGIITSNQATALKRQVAQQSKVLERA